MVTLKQATVILAVRLAESGRGALEQEMQESGHGVFNKQNATRCKPSFVDGDKPHASSRRSLKVQSRSADAGLIECDATSAGMQSAVSCLGSSSSGEMSLSLR